MRHSLNEIVFAPTGTADEIFEAIIDFIAANTPLAKDTTGLWLDVNKTCGIATTHTSGATTATFKGQTNTTALTTVRTIIMDSSNAPTRVHVSTNETAFYVKIGQYSWVFAQNINDVWTVFEADTTASSSVKISTQNSANLIITNSFNNIIYNGTYCSIYKFIDLYNQVLYKELYMPITIQSGLATDNGIVSFNGECYRFIKQALTNWNALAFPVSNET